MKEHDSGVLYQAVTNRRIQLGFLLPSFLCLDAPLVALGWSVAVTFDSGGSTDTCIPKLLILFFGVWSVYLADRIVVLAGGGIGAGAQASKEKANRDALKLRNERAKREEVKLMGKCYGWSWGYGYGCGHS